MPEISRLQGLAAVVFEAADWSDKNKNGRIDRNELLIPHDRPEEAKKEISTLIAEKYVPLIQKLDADNNGLSLEELKGYLRFDWNRAEGYPLVEIIQAIKTTGRYEAKQLPILIVSQEKVPAELLSSPIGKEIKKHLEENNCQALNYGFRDGEYFRLAVDPKDRRIVIAIPEAFLGEGVSEVNLGAILAHELFHSHQFFSGRLKEFFSVPMLLAGGKDEDANEAVKAGLEIDKSLTEIEAHLFSIDFLIKECGKHEDKKQIIAHIALESELFNRYMLELVKAIKLLEEKGRADVAVYVKGFLEEIFPKKKMREYNIRLADLTKGYEDHSRKCRIRREVTEELLNGIYGKTEGPKE